MHSDILKFFFLTVELFFVNLCHIDKEKIILKQIPYYSIQHNNAHM